MTEGNSGSWVMTALVTMVAVLAMPPIVFLVSGLVEQMPAGDVFAAMAAQFAGNARPNLLVTGVIGLLPLAVFGLVLFIHRRRNGQPVARRYMYWAGVIALLLVLAWSNHEFWRVFLPEQKSPGFPHGLELLIGPVFFAPVAMAAAMLAGWALGRRKP